MNMKYYDVIVKFLESVLANTISQLGNFDVECLNIGLKEETPPNIRGRYCLGEVTVKVPEGYLKRYYSVWQNFRLVEDRKVRKDIKVKESINFTGFSVSAA
ncbi:hypothetical protein V1478_018187 [Vespula squamosa]|uniref:Uncharacterized protein n=1 Tax=Vespula squamosa TaxID=30214 RepID=A0ABD1ZUZ6_VESSQ